MKTNLTNLALIALFAAAGPTACSLAGTPRGAEGPTRATSAVENVNIGDGSGPLPQAGARDTPKPSFTREELDAWDAKYPRD